MRVERVIANYERISDYKKIEDVYRDILEKYSDTSITASEVDFLLKNKRGGSYEPEKIGLTALEKKAYYSECMREKVAHKAAAVLCTNRYELEKYENLSLLLDFAGTEAADKKNRFISKVLTEGTQKEKEKVFKEQLKPLVEINAAGLEWKTDEELTEEWDKIEQPLSQFIVLDTIIKEAMETGMKFAPEALDKIERMQEKEALPAQMILCRAGVIANSYYALINDNDLRKIDKDVLKDLKEGTAFVFQDYLEDVIALEEGFHQNITRQMKKKLNQIGYDKPEDAVLVNIRGQKYDVESAIDVLKSGRLVYVRGENKKLSQVLELSGPDGFLKPFAAKRKDVNIKEYLNTSKKQVAQMVKGGEPLSPEEKTTARRYMATMVCFEKLMNERKLGNIRLWHAVGSDEKKFMKAVKHILEDQRFQFLTKDVTIESLGDFIDNHGEKKLSEQYTSLIVADNQKKAAQEVCVL